MAYAWINKLIIKIASEVHKNKIDDFEKRILVIEQDQKVILKTLNDIEAKLDKLDKRVYDNDIKTASFFGYFQSPNTTVIDRTILLNPNDNKNEIT